MGRRKTARQLRKEEEFNEQQKAKSVYDMSKYNPKKFKRAARRSKRSVFDSYKTKKTKKMDWL